MDKVIVVVGPTGVGKTKLGVVLAKHFDGEVISGDSMQIYKGMDIGTAKVTEDEREGIVHHLIDVKDPFQEYSVKEFQEQVRRCIDEISRRGKLPILVGGTGLYIKAALYDYTFNESTSNHEAIKAKYQEYSNVQLFEYLQKIDSKSASELHPNNRQRVLRAIEIYETTGVKKSETIASQQHVCLYDAIFIGLTLPRDVLYQRINQRVDSMMDAGLLEEVTSLYKLGCQETMQSMKAIGYKEWFAYFTHSQTKEETIEKIKKNSRNYAKRQYTWFNNQMPVIWFMVCLDHFSNTIEEVIQEIEGK